MLRTDCVGRHNVVCSSLVKLYLQQGRIHEGLSADTLFVQQVRFVLESWQQSGGLAMCHVSQADSSMGTGENGIIMPGGMRPLTSCMLDTFPHRHITQAIDASGRSSCRLPCL